MFESAFFRPGRAVWRARGAVLLCLGAAAAQAQPAPQPERAVAGVAVEALRQRAAALEHGEGVPIDRTQAAVLYCEAARAGDAESQYALGWMLASARGPARDEEAAAFFFGLAADQGMPQAANMLAHLPPRPGVPPACMRAPAAVPAASPQAPPAPLASTPPRGATPRIVALVNRTAEEHKVPVALVWAIMAAESGFDALAVSPRNAQGLMQLIPETAARFLVKDPFDARQNVRGGVAYLRWLLAYFQGDVALVAAAYNAGEGAVDRHAGVPPYPETRAYVQRILAAVGTDPQPYDPRAAQPSARLRSSPPRPAVR